MYSIKKSLLFSLVLLSVVLTAFSQTAVAAWPFDAEEKEEAKSSAPTSNQVKSTVTKIAAAVQSEDSEESDSLEAEDVEASNFQNVPGVPNYLPKIPTVPKIPSTQSLVGVSVPQVSYGTNTEIQRIQKQIQDIIKLNDTLKGQYSQQASQIQKISEQAKIHQKILQDLEETKQEAEDRQEASEKLINKEKVKLIQEETEQNKKFLNDLQDTADYFEDDEWKEDAAELVSTVKTQLPSSSKR